MGYNFNPIPTPLENSNLIAAQNAVTRAFELRDADLILTMLRVLYGMTSKKEIIDICEVTYRKIENFRKMEAAPIGYTQHAMYSGVLTNNSVLMERLMQFFFQIRLLLQEHKLTEFAALRAMNPNPKHIGSFRTPDGVSP